MFGFWKKDDLRALNQRMGRFLNSVTFSDIDSERQRSEGRIRLAEPCVVFLFSEAEAPKSYAIGVTREVSLHGMSMLVEGELALEDFVLILNAGDDRIILKATCTRCVTHRFGLFTVGFVFSKLLSDKDYPAILDALTYLESPKDSTEDSTTNNSKNLLIAET